jgi:methylmalonyl-CoA/ethylmalonyl-CoA epimerase
VAREAAKPANALGRLHQIALKATDLEASVAFYRDVLGLPLIARFDPPGLAFFDLMGTRLMLSANSTEATLYFAIADIHSKVKELQALGVSFEQPPTVIHRDDLGTFGERGGEEWMAFFRDPSGNLLAVAERR